VTESSLYPAIIGEYSRGDTRLFRIQAGLFWAGQVIEHTANRLVLLNPRAVKIGVPGMSDIIGWTSVPGTVDNYAEDVAIFTAIECKSARGRLTDEQSAFIHTVIRAGGRAGVARSVEEAGHIIRGENIVL
jgi:hypothetical protein